jgi:hypothetical protein
MVFAAINPFPKTTKKTNQPTCAIQTNKTPALRGKQPNPLRLASSLLWPPVGLHIPVHHSRILIPALGNPNLVQDLRWSLTSPHPWDSSSTDRTFFRMLETEMSF